MEKVELGQVYQMKGSDVKYLVYDITGNAKNTPNSDGRVVYLRVASKVGWFSQVDKFITITERKFWDHFTEF